MALSPAARVLVALTVAAALTTALLRVGYAQGEPTEPSPAATTPLSVRAVLTDSAALTPTQMVTAAAPAAILHTVQVGETLGAIVKQYNVTVAAVVEANKIANPDILRVGQVLVIPGEDGVVGALPVEADPRLPSQIIAASPISSSLIVSRLTAAGQSAPITSPYYKTTWLTYYGRPNVPVMGILGEMGVVSLTAELKEKARVLDAVNGSNLRVKPAFHLVHGMATVTPTEEGDYLEYLDDATVMQYITAGLKENIAVILDVQVGNVSVSEAISPVLKYLKYPNVHLAVDPEFAMSHPNQAVPGNPIGFVTGEQINEAMDTVEQYMTENQIRGRRIFLVHQFFDEMIIDKDALRWASSQLELTFCADGWGDPWGKITKYNNFFAESDAVKYTAFKMFYRWDVPVLTDAQSMGVEPFNENLGVQVTPNMIIYQ